jgi:amino acid permease
MIKMSFENSYSPLIPRDLDNNDNESQSEDDNQYLSNQLLVGHYTLRDKVENQSNVPGSETHVGTKFSSYVNLTNTIIGAGMLGLPYAFAKSGWVLGSILLFIGAISTIFSCHILSICASKVPYPATFFAVTNATVPKLTFLIDVAVFAQTFGAGCAYLIVVGGLMPSVMSQAGASLVAQSRFLWVMIGFAFVAPISFFNDLTKLNFTSSLAIVFAMFFILMVFLYSIPGASGLDACPDRECEGETSNILLSIDVLRVFSIFIFAFSCQINMFPVVNELRRPSQKRFDFVIKYSILTSCVIYLIVAVCGYKTFGDKVESNILINYPNNVWTSICRVCISFLVIFSYPLQVLPGRASLLALWRRFDKKNIDNSYISLSDNQVKFRHYACTLLFLGGTLGIALALNDLGKIATITYHITISYHLVSHLKS